jgi:hypothetical protein
MEKTWQSHLVNECESYPRKVGPVNHIDHYFNCAFLWAEENFSILPTGGAHYFNTVAPTD